jgi:transposase
MPRWQVLSHASHLMGRRLAQMSAFRGRMSTSFGRNLEGGITPEKLLRAILLQALYSIGSERHLLEQTQ